MMTRKHFEMIAASLKAARENALADLEGATPERIAAALFGVEEAARQTAYRLKVENPRFNFDRFMTACGCCGH